MFGEGNVRQRNCRTVGHHRQGSSTIGQDREQVNVQHFQWSTSMNEDAPEADESIAVSKPKDVFAPGSLEIGEQKSKTAEPAVTADVRIREADSSLHRSC